MKWRMLIWLCLVVNLSIAQQYFFVLLENAEKQPFVVKVNDKIYTGNHFITVPKLQKGTHEFVVEKSKIVSEKFIVNIVADDLGFVLKSSPDKGLVLFDINSFKTLIPISKEIVEVAKTEIQKPETPKKEEIKKEEVETPIKVVETYPSVQQKKESSELPNTKKEELKAAPINQENPPKEIAKVQEIAASKSTSRKIFENASDKGIDQIYVVDNGGKFDTVAIFVPQLSITTTIKETPKIAEPAPKVEVTAKSDDAPAKKVYANSNCVTLVSTSSFEQIIQAVSTESTDKAKLNKATSFFSKDCFSTNQIKQIGNLFNNDYYKFDFYRASKKLILDLQNFSTLNTTIKEEKVQEMFTDLLNN